MKRRQRMMCADAWPTTKRTRQKILLVNGHQHFSYATL